MKLETRKRNPHVADEGNEGVKLVDSVRGRLGARALELLVMTSRNQSGMNEIISPGLS